MYQYANPYQQQGQQPISGGASAMFQPGFAGTNVQEVRTLNAGHPAASVAGTYAAGISPAAPAGAVSSIFQPGFAGTNPQEVRAHFAGQPAPAVSGPLGMMHGFPQAGMAFGPSAAGSVFQPGFAGTNLHEVRAYNAGASTGIGAGSIFSPGFAGTNVQEVRALNAGHPAPSFAAPYGGAQAIMHQPPALQPMMGSSVHAIFQPGFAGTNAHEVRSDYALSQSQPFYGVTASPYRPF